MLSFAGVARVARCLAGVFAHVVALFHSRVVFVGMSFLAIVLRKFRICCYVNRLPQSRCIDFRIVDCVAGAFAHVVALFFTHVWSSLARFSWRLCRAIFSF